MNYLTVDFNAHAGGGGGEGGRALTSEGAPTRTRVLNRIIR